MDDYIEFLPLKKFEVHIHKDLSSEAFLCPCKDHLKQNVKLSEHIVTQL